MKHVTITAERTIAAPASAVWEAVADLPAYAQVASSLSRVDVTGSGEQLRRRCHNTRGQSWEEHCTLWEEGRRYRMEVDTATYPAPLRQLLRSFAGTWSVEPTAAGSRVSLAFEAVPRFGPLGRILVRLMGRRARGELEGILDAYERTATRSPSAQAA
jgi:ribosome-associated toxin RatA of RatAB toxin-antitoxin module